MFQGLAHVQAADEDSGDSAPSHTCSTVSGVLTQPYLKVICAVYATCNSIYCEPEAAGAITFSTCATDFPLSELHDMATMEICRETVVC